MSLIVLTCWLFTIPRKRTSGIGIWKNKKTGDAIILVLVSVSVVASFIVASCRDFFIGQKLVGSEVLMYTLLYIVAASLPVCIVVYWIITTSVMIKQRNEISLTKKIMHSIISFIFIVTIAVPIIILGYISVKWNKFEKSDIQQYQIVENMIISSYRETYSISFYVKPNNLEFDTVEEIFELTLDKLQNTTFFNIIESSHILRTTFEMAKAEVTFYEIGKQSSIIFRFSTVENRNYNKWKILDTQNLEYLNKEYYREIASESSANRYIEREFI